MRLPVSILVLWILGYSALESVEPKRILLYANDNLFLPKIEKILNSLTDVSAQNREPIFKVINANQLLRNQADEVKIDAVIRDQEGYARERGKRTPEDSRIRKEFASLIQGADIYIRVDVRLVNNIVEFQFTITDSLNKSISDNIKTNRSDNARQEVKNSRTKNNRDSFSKSNDTLNMYEDANRHYLTLINKSSRYESCIVDISKENFLLDLGNCIKSLFPELKISHPPTPRIVIKNYNPDSSSIYYIPQYRTIVVDASSSYDKDTPNDQLVFHWQQYDGADPSKQAPPEDDLYIDPHIKVQEIYFDRIGKYCITLVINDGINTVHKTLQFQVVPPVVISADRYSYNFDYYNTIMTTDELPPLQPVVTDITIISYTNDTTTINNSNLIFDIYYQDSYSPHGFNNNLHKTPFVPNYRCDRIETRFILDSTSGKLLFKQIQNIKVSFDIEFPEVTSDRIRKYNIGLVVRNDWFLSDTSFITVTACIIPAVKCGVSYSSSAYSPPIITRNSVESVYNGINYSVTLVLFHLSTGTNITTTLSLLPKEGPAESTFFLGLQKQLYSFGYLSCGGALGALYSRASHRTFGVISIDLEYSLYWSGLDIKPYVEGIIGYSKVSRQVSTRIPHAISGFAQANVGVRLSVF